jgi:hypothetical protein
VALDEEVHLHTLGMPRLLTPWPLGRGVVVTVGRDSPQAEPDLGSFKVEAAGKPGKNEQATSKEARA